MILSQNDSGTWSVIYKDKPIAISGTVIFATREEAVEEIQKRGLSVADTGEISRGGEPSQSPEETPPTEDAPEPAEVVEDAPEVVEDAPEAVEDAPEVVETPPAEGVQEPAEVVEDARDDQESRPKRSPGRPPLFTKEEIAERRRRQNRESYHAQSEARKAEIAERSRRWREANQDKIREYRRAANERRRKRYAEDPDYREKVKRSVRESEARRKRKTSDI